MRVSAPEVLEDWKLEKERTQFFNGYPAGALRQDRSKLSDDMLRPWLQDHRGLSGYPRATRHGYLTVARLLSLDRDDSDPEGPDISATFAWIDPEGQVHRQSVKSGYDRYSPGGLGALLEDQSAFITDCDSYKHRGMLQVAPFSVLPPGLPTELVRGWPEVALAMLSRVLRLKTLRVSVVVLQQEGLPAPDALPGAITLPLPSAFPNGEGLIFPSVLPEVEAFHDLPFSAVQRAYEVINSPDFERQLSELDPPGLVVIASQDRALSRRFSHLLRGLRRAQRRPLFHISHLAGSVRDVRI